MVTRKLFCWFSFIISGAIAYPIVFMDVFWPMVRVIAGWYAIFVIVVVVCAGLIWLSLKLGLIRHRPGFLDAFDFF